MAVLTNFAKSIRPGILRWVNDGWVSQSKDYQGIIGETVNTNNGFEEYMHSTGVGLLTQTAIGESSPTDNPIEGYLQRINNRKYTATTEVAKEDWNRDRYNVIKKAAMNMGAGAAQTYNYWSFNPLRGGFTSTITYADAQELFSTSHARMDGGTAISNASSTGIPLTYNNLETGVLALYDQVDDKGRISTIGDGSLTLVVPKDLELEAITITRSTKKSGVADNDMNFWEGRVNVLTTKWVRSSIAARESDGVAGSATAWYLVDPATNTMTFQLEQPFVVEDDYHPRNRVATFTGSTLFRVGPQNWRGWWGSKGDNAAYSG